MLSDPSGEKPYFGLVISSPKMNQLIRLVNVVIPYDIVISTSQNNVYQQVPFSVVLSQEKEGQTPRLELRASVIKNRISNFMYATDGGLNTKIDLQVLLRSREEAALAGKKVKRLVCTVEASVELFVLEVALREDFGTMQLGYQLPLNTAAVRETYNEKTSPGLF